MNVMAQTKWVIVLVLLAAVAAAQSKGGLKAPPALTATPDPQAEAELRQLERAWLDAYDNNDAAAMESILADGFVITYGDGKMLDKKQVIAGLKPGAPKNPDAQQYTEDSTVRIYGDTAVITGRYIYKQRKGDKETVSQSRYTDTYIKLKGRWQVVASHLAMILR